MFRNLQKTNSKLTFKIVGKKLFQKLFFYFLNFWNFFHNFYIIKITFFFKKKQKLFF